MAAAMPYLFNIEAERLSNNHLLASIDIYTLLSGHVVETSALQVIPSIRQDVVCFYRLNA